MAGVVRKNHLALAVPSEDQFRLILDNGPIAGFTSSKRLFGLPEADERNPVPGHDSVNLVVPEGFNYLFRFTQWSVGVFV